MTMFSEFQLNLTPGSVKRGTSMLVGGPQNGDFTRMKNFDFPKFFTRKILSNLRRILDLGIWVTPNPPPRVMQYEVKYSDFPGNKLGNLKNNRRLSELEFHVCIFQNLQIKRKHISFMMPTSASTVHNIESLK